MPDLTHNDTIKRIQSSNENIEFLKKLAKKQVERLKQQKRGRDIETANKLNSNKFNEKRPQQQQQQQRRSLGKLESVEQFKRQQQQFALKKTGCHVKQNFSIKTQDLPHVSHHNDVNSANVGTGTLKYFLQLATDYYQQGFLQNIKYLENLAERNQLKRKRHLQQQLQQLQKKTIFTHTVDGRTNKKTNTNILNLKSISLENKCITAAPVNSSDIKQQEINPILWRKCRQQIDNNLTANEFPLKSDKSRNCAIRVNIKPQAVNTSHQGNFFQISKGIYGKNKSKDFNSMNDYLNGNLEYTQLQQQQQEQHQQPQTHFHNLNVINNHNYSSKVIQLNTLIDNLSELDIQENRTNLPRITLTDYTRKYPNDELDSNCRITQEDYADERRNRLNSYLIKQSSLDCSNLDIPRETHYRSEARPP